MNSKEKVVFPDIDSWKSYLSRLTKADQFSEAYKTLLRGVSGKTMDGQQQLHRFDESKQMGLAIWCIDQQAKKNKCYRLKSDNTYRQSHEPPIIS